MRRGLEGVQTPTFAFGRKAQQWNCTSDNEEEIVRRTRNRSPIGVEVPMCKEEEKNVLHWNTGIAPAFKENEKWTFSFVYSAVVVDTSYSPSTGLLSAAAP